MAEVSAGAVPPAAGNMAQTLNFAHRGFRSKYPENTMLAFSKAVEIGVHGIEFDVHLSADGIPVIIHDEMTERTCGISGFVKDRPFKELRRLNAAAQFEKAAGVHLSEKIPSLEEYCDFIRHKNIISNIELKTGIFEYPGIEEKVLLLLKKYGLIEKCIVSSFNHESVVRMKKIAPCIPCGFLADSWELDPAPYVKKYGIECYHPPAYRLTKEFVENLHSEGLRVNAWFGSVQTDYARVLETCPDILITDYPDKIAHLLR